MWIKAKASVGTSDDCSKFTDLITDVEPHWCKTTQAGHEPSLARETAEAPKLMCLITNQDEPRRLDEDLLAGVPHPLCHQKSFWTGYLHTNISVLKTIEEWEKFERMGVREGNLFLQKVCFPLCMALPWVLLLYLPYRNPAEVPEPAVVLAIAAFTKPVLLSPSRRHLVICWSL